MADSIVGGFSSASGSRIVASSLPNRPARETQVLIVTSGSSGKRISTLEFHHHPVCARNFHWRPFWHGSFLSLKEGRNTVRRGSGRADRQASRDQRRFARHPLQPVKLALCTAQCGRMFHGCNTKSCSESCGPEFGWVISPLLTIAGEATGRRGGWHRIELWVQGAKPGTGHEIHTS